MDTITVILDWADIDALATVRQIEKKFPCWTVIEDIDEDSYELTVRARAIDVPYIEKMLAPFV
jgi:hypothetical protein